MEWIFKIAFVRNAAVPSSIATVFWTSEQTWLLGGLRRYLPENRMIEKQPWIWIFISSKCKNNTLQEMFNGSHHIIFHSSWHAVRKIILLKTLLQINHCKLSQPHYSWWIHLIESLSFLNFLLVFTNNLHGLVLIASGSFERKMYISRVGLRLLLL